MAYRPLLGEITLFAGAFVPRGHAPCTGFPISISRNLDLFAYLWTLYGGDGYAVFGLPDLSGRICVGAENEGERNYATRPGKEGGTDSLPVGPISTGSGVELPVVLSNAADNYMPYLVLNYCIATTGIAPGRQGD